MMQLSRIDRLIKLETMTNARDLGGYETQDGHFTKTHKYVRTANPSYLDETGKELLYKYGVRVQIDLRSDYEFKAQPSQLKGYLDIEYYSVNLMQESHVAVVPTDIKNYKDLSGLYIYIIESCKDKVKEVFEIFLKHLDVTVLYNCSAGKDRTGVISALLLDLVGCHEYDIVKDYAESYENNLPILSELEKMIGQEHKQFLGSNPSYMMKFLAYLKEQYGSAKEYLVSCGIDESDLQVLIDNFKI